MKLRIITCSLLFAFATAGLAREIDRQAVAHAELSRYLEDWTKNLAHRYKRRAYKHADKVVQWSIHYGVDVLLVARIISLESSWRVSVIGDVGEIGLMQIKNAAMLKKYDVNDPSENIRAGCDLLRTCLDKCGSVKAAIGCYGTGHCTTDGDWLQRRYKMHLSDVKKFRAPNPSQ